jgi:hypothetical protein
MRLRTTTLLAALPPVLAALPAVGLLTLAADRLPDPLAVHFALDGTADAFLPRWAVLAVDGALGLLLAALLAGAARAADARSGRALVAASWAVGGLLAPVLLGSVAVQLDRPDAAGVVLPLGVLPLALVTGALAGLVGHRLAPRPAGPAGEPPSVPPLPVGATERVTWSRRVSARWSGPAALLVLAAGAGALVVGPAPVALVAVPVAAAALLLGSARVTVDHRGLTVALGVLGRPRVHVPREDIVSATTTDVVPMRFGGWGYRIVPGGRGIIVRGGPALVVTRRSGRRLTVTVDDPGTAAGLLAGLVRC